MKKQKTFTMTHKAAKELTATFMEIIAKCCVALGWTISFNRETKSVDYLIIGKSKAVNKILKKLDN